jgi:hypothetical protein
MFISKTTIMNPRFILGLLRFPVPSSPRKRFLQTILLATIIVGSGVSLAASDPAPLGKLANAFLDSGDRAGNTHVSVPAEAAIAISGNTAVVGVFDEDSSAIGVNGDASDNRAATSGAACLCPRYRQQLGFTGVSQGFQHRCQ